MNDLHKVTVTGYTLSEKLYMCCNLFFAYVGGYLFVMFLVCFCKIIVYNFTGDVIL